MTYYKFAYSMMSLFMFLALPLFGAETQQAQDMSIVKTTNDPNLGEMLTDSKGMTLYIFTDDKENVSNCYEECSALWPPLLVKEQVTMTPELEGKLGVINRNDKTLQVAFKGQPLYYYQMDNNPGDTTGQNVENKWFVVNPNK